MRTEEIDLSDLEFWAKPLAERDAAFATLRAQADLVFFEEPEMVGLPKGPGFYALTRHAEVVEASRHPELFCSSKGTNIGDMPTEFLEFFGSMINMDDPRHTRLRRIVSRVFTPRYLESLKADVTSIADEILWGIAERGSVDFVTEVAALLPLRVIVDLMGIPRSQESFIFDRTNVILGVTDTEYAPDQSPDAITAALLGAGAELATMVTEIGEERVRNPANDITTALVTAEVDGEQLTPAELASFFILLVVAGNETTRNAIAHGVSLFDRNPDQRDLLLADPDRFATMTADEIVRYASPVALMRRTATRDARIGDVAIREGEKVVMWYRAANFDEDWLDDPYRFDITRSPNDHVGFGAGGPHFCLGASLARLEIGAMLATIAERLPGLEVTGPPAKLRTLSSHGVKHLPVRLGVR
jgi:cytochrome P450